MSVQIRQVPPHRMACFRHTGSYSQLGRTFDALTAWIHTSNAPRGLVCGVFFDDLLTTPEAQLRAAAGLTVPDDFVTDDHRVEIIDFRAGTYAVATFEGAYEGLPKAWDALTENWLPSSGHSLGEGPRFEKYLEANDEGFMGELWLPVSP